MAAAACNVCGTSVTFRTRRYYKGQDLCPSCLKAIEDAEPKLALPPPLTGIEGWLVLPAIGFVVSPFVDALSAYLAFSVSERVAEDVRPLVMGEGALAGAFVVFDIVVAVMFFTKKPFAPALVISWLVSRLVFAVADTALASAIYPTSQGGGEIFRAFVGSCIWIPYFLNSRRVRNTFREPPNNALEPSAREPVA